MKYASPFLMKILIALFFIINAKTTHAYCYIWAAGNGKDLLFDMPPTSVYAEGVQVGGKIGPEIVGPLDKFGCDQGSVSNGTQLYHEIVSIGTAATRFDNRNIYPTSVNGIGFAYAIEFLKYCSGTFWAPSVSCRVQRVDPQDINYRMHIQFYKTGITTYSGNYLTLSLPQYGFLKATSVFTTTSDSQLFTLTTSKPSYTVLHTCLVQTPSITNINLPLISTYSLPSIGSTAAMKPFYISVNCNTPFKIGMTFTDNNNPSQSTNVLTPSAASTAKGVGIQLKYNNTIIKYGPDNITPGTLNQIMLNNSSISGTQNFPFTASYVRTGTTIVPGTLGATATFTLSYQ